MQRPFIGVIVILFGLLGVLGFRFWQTSQLPLFVPTASSTTLQPPSQAITATLSESKGDVQQFTREADAYQDATPAGSLRQGESIATKLGSATITLDTLGSVAMQANTELSFINLIPSSIMMLHKDGTAVYEVNESHPFSIRVAHALITLSGDATITRNDDLITILMNKGTAKLAMVDSDNNTHTWNLVEGQSARVEDDIRNVTLRD